MLDFTLENNGGGGGGSFSEAALSYPTGTQALNNTELYSYIKTMYDVAPSETISDTNLTFSGTYTITDSGIITYHADQARIYGTLPTTSNVPTSFVIKGSVTPKTDNNEVSVVKLTNSTTKPNNNDDVYLQLWNNQDHPYAFVLYYRIGTETRTYKFSGNNLWSVNTKLYFEIQYDGTSLRFLTGNSPSNLTEQISATDFSPTVYKYLYFASTVSPDYDSNFDINLDLNDYSYYLNGTLNFTPYYYEYVYKTLATGGRVVDVTYSDVIAGMKTRYGSALYFIIDTTNHTITLPQGDIFGFITQAIDLAQSSGT